MKNMQRNQTDWNITQHPLTKTSQKQKYNRSKGKASTHEHLQKEWLPIEGDCNTKSSHTISHNLTKYWTLTEHYKIWTPTGTNGKQKKINYE